MTHGFPVYVISSPLSMGDDYSLLMFISISPHSQWFSLFTICIFMNHVQQHGPKKDGSAWVKKEDEEKTTHKEQSEKLCEWIVIRTNRTPSSSVCREGCGRGDQVIELSQPHCGSASLSWVIQSFSTAERSSKIHLPKLRSHNPSQHDFHAISISLNFFTLYDLVSVLGNRKIFLAAPYDQFWLTKTGPRDSRSLLSHNRHSY